MTSVRSRAKRFVNRIIGDAYRVLQFTPAQADPLAKRNQIEAIKAPLYAAMANPCMLKRRDNEPFFVFLARDASAPVALRAWGCDRVRQRGREGVKDYLDAERWAQAFEAYRKLDDKQASLDRYDRALRIAEAGSSLLFWPDEYLVWKARNGCSDSGVKRTVVGVGTTDAELEASLWKMFTAYSDDSWADALCRAADAVDKHCSFTHGEGPIPSKRGSAYVDVKTLNLKLDADEIDEAIKEAVAAKAADERVNFTLEDGIGELSWRMTVEDVRVGDIEDVVRRLKSVWLSAGDLDEPAPTAADSEDLVDIEELSVVGITLDELAHRMWEMGQAGATMADIKEQLSRIWGVARQSLTPDAKDDAKASPDDEAATNYMGRQPYALNGQVYWPPVFGARPLTAGEIALELRDYSFVMENAASVYAEASGGRVSNVLTYSGDVLGAIDEATQSAIHENYVDWTEELMYGRPNAVLRLTKAVEEVRASEARRDRMTKEAGEPKD